MFGNLTNQSSGIFANKSIRIPKAIESVGEDFSLDHRFSEIDSMLCNLREGRANLSSEFGIGTGEEGSNESNRVGINDGLCELLT